MYRKFWFFAYHKDCLMPEYAQIDLFVYKAKIFRNRFVTIGWFNQINYMRGRRQDRILFLIGSSPAGGLFLFLPAELSNIKKQFESLTCIKGEDTHIADFPFSGKAVSVPLPFAPLSDSEDSKSYCMQVYPSVLHVRRKEKNHLWRFWWDRPLLPGQYRLSASRAGAWQGFHPCKPSWTVRADDGACRQIVNQSLGFKISDWFWHYYLFC